jgi:FliI/YscN family ATPase
LIQSRFVTGIRAIDAFVPMGLGQRLAVLAEPGVGKSSLLAAVAHASEAEVNVIGLIGERAREVQELASGIFSAERQSRTVIVASTSAEPAIRRILAAMTATRIAEHFRERGLSVLLQVDSLTRLFRAYREVGLAAGEVPVRRGYPPSVFSRLPELIERAGTSAAGAITALYTVLLSSDMDEDPMVDEVKGLTDGHILLSRSVAERCRYPAIDLQGSISRLASRLDTPEVREAVRQVRSAALTVAEDRELSLLGGTVHPRAQERREFESALHGFLAQDSGERSSLEHTHTHLLGLAAQARALEL